MTTTQRNYSAGQKEAWALVASTRHWYDYLKAVSHVYLESDHNPLAWLRAQKDPRHTYARWILELEEFDYTIIYRKGKDNVVADCLSRSNTEMDVEINDDSQFFEDKVYQIGCDSDCEQEIKDEQWHDPAISYAKRQLMSEGSITKGRYKRYSRMRISNGILCRGRRVIIPPILREKITQRVHSFGHTGRSRTADQLKVRYFWHGMDKYVKRICSECLACAKSKHHSKPKETLQPYIIDELSPRSAVALDIATLPWAENGDRYFLMIVDMFSRLMELVPMKDQAADTLINAFTSGWLHRHGIPHILVTDQGKNVDGLAMNKLCRQLGIDKRRSSPYHPEGDGLAERSIGTVKQVMRCLLADRLLKKTDWPLLLGEISFICNSLKNSSTGRSPHEVCYGEELRSTLDMSLNNNWDKGTITSEEHYEELRERIDGLKGMARGNSEHAHKNSKRFYDRGKTDSDIAKSDEVLLRDQARESSLDPIFIGPYIVMSRKGANVLLQEPKSRKEKWVHLNRCKIFRRAIDTGIPITTPQDIAEEDILSDVDKYYDFDDAMEEEKDSKNIKEGEEIERPMVGGSRAKRERKQTEFFGEPVPWDALK